MAGSESEIPQWKRDLIERRRASGRSITTSSGVVSLTCPGVVSAVRYPAAAAAAALCPSPGSPAGPPGLGPDSAPSHSASFAAADFHPASRSPSVSVGGNMRLVEQRDDLTFNGGSLDGDQPELIKPRAKMGEEKATNKVLSNPRVMARVSKHYLSKVENKNHKKDVEDECHSDSSEELQYGPGIVKKLKSKYLSMTLRESGPSSRPSLSSMRRATSLENLLEEESVNKQVDGKQSRYVKRAQGGQVRAPVSSHQSRSAEPSQRDMKRARSMETLLRYDPRLHMSHSNSGLNVHLEDAEKDENDDVSDQIRQQEETEQMLLRKKLAITVGETELPPPDVVKQTLKIFESPGCASSPVPVPPVRNSNHKQVPKVNNSVSKKPQLSPKPVFSPEKLRRTPPKVVSPKKVVEASVKGGVSDSVSVPVSCRHVPESSPVPVTPVSPLMSPMSPVSPMRSSPARTPPSPRKTMGLPLLSPTEDKPPPIPRREKSPTSSVSVTPTTPVNGSLHGRPESLDIKPVYSTSESDGDEDLPDAAASRTVSSSALENIRKDGTSMQFSFGSNKSPSKDEDRSYLPKVKPTPPKDLHIPARPTPTSNVRPVSPFENSSPDISTKPGTVMSVSVKSPETPVQHVKQVGVIRPLVSTKQHSPHNASPTATPLTNREIEKNLINRVKSIEQPVTKVVVSLKKLPDDVVVGSVSHSALAFTANGEEGAGASSKRGKVPVPGLWDKKPWHHQDNTMVFNFSNRKDVPDYIENDGLILRSKREKPRVGDGSILLLDASADESSTDVDLDEWGLVCSDPPSPCNVVFDGGNVLINGRSNLRNKPRPPEQRKLRIQFNDNATTMFEYPSEASLLDESRGSAPGVAPPPPPSGAPPSPPSGAPGHPVPLGSGSLASYTPSKLQMAGGESFQLGVTRAPSSVTSPSASSPDGSARAPELCEDNDHVKPARETESVPWSEESGTDLLF